MSADMVSRLGRLGYVDLLGTVQDSRELFGSCSVIGLPVFVHGGTPLKLVEAMARGKAVVASTALTARLPVSDGHDVLIRNEPASFAEAVAGLLENREENERLGRNARQTFLRIWSRAITEEVMRRASVLVQP